MLAISDAILTQSLYIHHCGNLNLFPKDFNLEVKRYFNVCIAYLLQFEELELICVTYERHCLLNQLLST